MRYLCIVYECHGPDTSRENYLESPVVREVIGNMESLSAHGHLIAASPLDEPSTAKTIRVRDDGVMVSDGPFAETKELIGGFYLINASSIDEAVQLASTMPPARIGAIEVRPLKEFILAT